MTLTANWSPCSSEIDTEGKFTTGVNDIGGHIFPESDYDGGVFAAAVNDDGGVFAACVNDDGGVFPTGVNDNGGEFSAGVNNTGAWSTVTTVSDCLDL